MYVALGAPSFSLSFLPKNIKTYRLHFNATAHGSFGNFFGLRMSRKLKATNECAPSLTSPSPAEKQAIARATLRMEARSPRVRVECTLGKDGALSLIGGAHNDHHGWLRRLQDVFGTRGNDFALSQLNRLMVSCRDADGKIDGARLNGLLAMIEGAAPTNEVQAALAVQMALTHTAAQTVLQRAMRVDQIPQFESASNAAVKLLRTFAMQAETLAKLQRGGEQVVRIVHVHPGAQAIVGNVVHSRAGAGGGGDDEKGSQPHAPEAVHDTARRIEAQSGTALSCLDPGGTAVPVPCGQREKPLPNARRRAG